MTVSWVDVENAVQGVIVRCSGLAADRVTWGYQNVNETERDHVVINFDGARGIGVDRVHATQDLTRANGQEIAQEVRGLREAPLEIAAYTAGLNGDSAARQLCERIRTRLRLDTSIFDLRRAQVSIFDKSAPIQWRPYIPSTEYRGYAVLPVRCYVPITAAIEYVGYIARVRGMVYPAGYVGPSGATGLAFDSAQAP